MKYRQVGREWKLPYGRQPAVSFTRGSAGPRSGARRNRAGRRSGAAQAGGEDPRWSAPAIRSSRLRTSPFTDEPEGWTLVEKNWLAAVLNELIGRRPIAEFSPYEVIARGRRATAATLLNEPGLWGHRTRPRCMDGRNWECGSGRARVS